MFFEAQIMTQELKRGNDNLDKQGHVYLYPESTLGMDNLTPFQTLVYIKYQSDNKDEETFKKKLEENSPNIQQYFSVNPQGQLVLAAVTITSVTTSSETDGHSTSNGNNGTVTYEAEEVTIDYKSMISQYATPMNFFLQLGMVTRNPEFLAAVVELVKDKTNIQLTVLNTTTTEITKQVDKSTEHTKGRKIVKGKGEVVALPYSSESTTTTTTTTTKVTQEPSVRVTSVDTWICSQKITYSKIPGIPFEENYTIKQESESEPSLSSDTSTEDEVSWITREDSTVHISTKRDTYDAGIASNYIDNTDEFIKLLDIEYKIPNSKEKRTAGAYLKTDAELFFHLLSQNPETQGMEIVMRYIMQKYDKNGDYGAEDFSFNMFDGENYTTVEGIEGQSVEQKLWNALRKFGYSNQTIAGAMGNIYCISGFNPTKLDPSTGAYGIGQWSGSNRTYLQNYAASKGKTEDDEDIQIEFLIAELTETGDAANFVLRRTAGGNGENYHTYKDWLKAKDEREAAITFCWFYQPPSQEKTKTEEILKIEKERADAASKYYTSHQNSNGTGGTTSGSDDKSVRCYYTASNGRKFTILDQNKIPGWSSCCNQAACAIIASGYSNQTPEQLIANRKKEGAGPYYGAIAGNSYWNQYGLKITKTDSDLDLANYQNDLRKQLSSGGYALIWINNNQKTYYGKSGIKWTSLYHWVSIIDYRNQNGKEQMAVADCRGITWVGLDEFTTHGVTHMLFVNEK